MLKIVVKGPNSCPVITCDWCNQEIEDAFNATYAFVMAVGKDPDMVFPDESEIFYLHNGSCFLRFEAYKDRTEAIFLGTIPLECLPVYMAANLGINWLKAYKSAQLMAGYSSELTPRLEQSEWATVRKQVLKRDHYQCQYCEGKATEVDHVIPISRGGTNELTNLVAACYSCNRTKRAQSVEEWLR